jgi:hypothetical protein
VTFAMLTLVSFMETPFLKAAGHVLCSLIPFGEQEEHGRLPSWEAHGKQRGADSCPIVLP